jgi:hypothetical protein
VVDIVDNHQNFKNQWAKRKAFYRKEDYKILYTTSGTYSSDTRLWKVVFNPKRGISAKDDDNDNVDNDNVDNDNVDKEPTGKCLIHLKKK